MNAKKTTTMVVTRKEETSEINIKIDGCKIDQVNNFKHLGQTDRAETAYACTKTRNFEPP